MSQLAELEKENAILREQVAQLRDVLAPPEMIFPNLSLQPGERDVLALLVERTLVSHDDYQSFRYGAGKDVRDEWRLLTVYISHLRKKLRPLNIKIHLSRSIGYYVSAADRARLREMAT